MLMHGGVRLVACVGVVAAQGCGGGDSSGPSPPSYTGNWSGIQVPTMQLVGTGITFVVTGSSITSLSIATENHFGVGIGGSPPGCLLAFRSVGAATISGASFQVSLEVSPTPVSGVSTLAPAVGVAFSGTPSLQGTFQSANRASGQLSYNVTSAACGGRTFIGIGPGFGANTRAWTASR